MAVKVLNPIAAGNYAPGAVTPVGSVAWQNLADNEHGTSTSPAIGGAPGSRKESYKFEEIPADVPAITPVSRVEEFYVPVTAGCSETGTGLTVKMLTRQAATDLLGSDLAPVVDAGPNCESGSLAIKSYVFPTRYDGAAWTVADFQGGGRAEFGDEVAFLAGSTSTEPSNAKLWLIVEYLMPPPNFDAARDVGSRIERLRRRLAFTFEIGVPLWFMDCEILDDVLVSYLAADDPKGQGWLYKAWQRGWLSIIGATVDRNSNELTLELFYMRDFACLQWDTMVSEATAGLYGQGAARLGLGQVRTFSRASGAWVKENAAGLTKASTKGGLYFLAVDGVEKITSEGTVVMSTRTNKLFHSSYIQGTLPAATGHVFEGTGGGNTGAAEDVPSGILPLFEKSVGARRAKIVKGTAAEVQDRNTTVVSVAANAIGWAAFGHLDLDATKPGKWAARRIVAGVTSWWDQSAGGGVGAFGAGGGAKVWNPLTGSATQPVVDRYKIPFGAGAGTIELMQGVDAAASNRTFYPYHSEWVEGAYVSDELIVTTTAAYTVQPDLLSDANNSGSPAESSRIMPSTGFSWGVEGKSYWNPSDLAAGEKRVLMANEFDANNKVVVYYDKDTQRVKSVYTQAGTPVTASAAVTIAKGAWHRYALRITGSAGEEDLTPYTMGVFIDGLPGDSPNVVTPITMTSTATLKRGHQGAGTDLWDGVLRNWETDAEILSDEEEKGRP